MKTEESKDIKVLSKRGFYIQSGAIAFSTILTLITALSQFTSVWDYFKKDKFNIVMGSKLEIIQNFGNPQFYQNININNLGGAGVITKVELNLKTVDSDRLNENYTGMEYNFTSGRRNGFDEQYAPMSTISIKAGEQTNFMVRFGYTMSQVERSERSKLVNDYENKYWELFGKKQRFYPQEELKKEIDAVSEYFNDRLKKYQLGTYQYTVSLYKNFEIEPFKTYKANFYLSSEDIMQMREHNKPLITFLKYRENPPNRTPIVVNLTEVK